MRLAGVGADNSILNHPLLGPGRITGARELGPFPDNQVAQTIGLMRKRVLEDRANAEFQDHAYRVMSGMGADHVSRAWEQARSAITFINDKDLAGGLDSVNPDNVVELIIRPLDMARLIDQGRAAGDCDDFNMYCAALLECYGIPTSFVTVAADDREPDQYSHVYLRAYPYEGGRKGNYVSLDPSHGPYAGWECPNFFGKLREWPVDDPWLWLGVTGELLAMSLFVGFAVWAIWK